MDDALPGMPTPPPARPPRTPKDGLTVQRLRTTKLCDRCCQLIHEQGVQQAPYPARAYWRVIDVELNVERLCGAHKDERTT